MHHTVSTWGRCGRGVVARGSHCKLAHASVWPISQPCSSMQLTDVWTLCCKPALHPDSPPVNQQRSRHYADRRNAWLWHTLHSPSDGFPGSSQSAVPPTHQTAFLQSSSESDWCKCVKNVSGKSDFIPSRGIGLIRQMIDLDADPKNVSLISPLLACSEWTFKRKPLC